MTIAETYEKFKHFDELLSDREWLPQNIHGILLHEFWLAIRETAQPNTVSAHPPVTEDGGVDNDG